MRLAERLPKRRSGPSAGAVPCGPAGESQAKRMGARGAVDRRGDPRPARRRLGDAVRSAAADPRGRADGSLPLAGDRPPSGPLSGRRTRLVARHARSAGAGRADQVRDRTAVAGGRRAGAQPRDMALAAPPIGMAGIEMLRRLAHRRRIVARREFVEATGAPVLGEAQAVIARHVASPSRRSPHDVPGAKPND